MYKRNFALLIILAMLACLIAGCSSGGQQSTSQKANESAEAAAENSVATAAAVDSITYPLTGDDLSFSYWYYAPPYTKWVSSNADFYGIPYAEKATGVKINFTECSSTAATEQFNLMVASGDWTDLIPVNEYYTGGLSQAYSDGVITDMTDLINQYMPDYNKVLKAQDETVQNGVLTDGLMLAFAQIADGTYSGNGFVTRGDWLKEVNYEFSGSTIKLSDFTDLLRMMVNQFGCESAYYVKPDGLVSGLSSAFDTSVPSLSGTSTSSNVYRNGDTIVSGWTSDGTRKYVEWFNGLVNEGVLSKDFITASTDQGDYNTACGTGKVGVWTANADKIDELATYVDEANAGLQAQAAPNVVADDNTEGQTMWNTEPNLVSLKMSLSSTSEKGDLICKWMNYFWTEDGNTLANYGVKGETFDYDESGNIKWLDKITNDPQGANVDMATELYTFKRFSTFYNDNDKLLSTFTENASAAVSLWTQPGTYERQYPNFAGLTTDESSQTSTLVTDINTYGQQLLLRWMTGEDQLTDDSWNEYVQTMNDMGLSEVLSAYQNAYNEYKAGTRHIAVPSTAAGSAPK